MDKSLSVLVKAIADPTDKNIKAALRDSDLAGLLKGISSDDFRLLANLIRRFVALARQASGVGAEDAAVLESFAAANLKKSVCDVA
jgi:hypothetical protein